jgi:AcrR family transcriptional regulator
MVQKPSATAPTRGRPRGFDTDEVLARVRDTFWKHGYAGTSMDQLSAATGLHKPSLYGAFGDKKALYLAALDNYLAEVRAEFAEAFAVPTLFESLYAVSECSIDKFLRGENAGTGCFMMSTAVPEAAADPEISKVVRDSMESLEQAFVRRFQKAVEDGEIPATIDPNVLTMILVANHYEMSGRARAGYSREELRKMGDRAQDLVKSLVGFPTNDK